MQACFTLRTHTCHKTHQEGAFICYVMPNFTQQLMVIFAGLYESKRQICLYRCSFRHAADSSCHVLQHLILYKVCYKYWSSKVFESKLPPAFFSLVCRLLQIFDIWGTRCNNHRIAFSKAIFFHNFFSLFQIVLIAKSGLTLPIIKRHKLPLKESR